MCWWPLPGLHKNAEDGFCIGVSRNTGVLTSYQHENWVMNSLFLKTHNSCFIPKLQIWTSSYECFYCILAGIGTRENTWAGFR